MAERPHRRIELVASKLRTGAVVAVALLLGATGALAATAPDVVRFSPSATTTTVTQSVTETAAPEPTDTEPTDTGPTDTGPTTTATTDTATVTVTSDVPKADGPEKADGADKGHGTDKADGTEKGHGTEKNGSRVPAPVACPDATNHGQYVSGVARSVEPGPAHGAAVREAARSDCGKPSKDD